MDFWRRRKQATLDSNTAGAEKGKPDGSALHPYQNARRARQFWPTAS